VVKRRARTALQPSAPLPAAVSPPPTVAPTRPLFGVTMDSITDGPSSVSVPIGESTTADPRAPREGSGPQAPPSAPPPPHERPYKPVSSVSVKVLPEIDAEACGRGIQYPKEARALGIEGDVVLRVELDETGKVRRVRVVSGLGHGLDQAAVAALMRTCRFTPAFDSSGQPVAYIIPAYTFHFELPR
jgi:protein TonB